MDQEEKNASQWAKPILVSNDYQTLKFNQNVKTSSVDSQNVEETTKFISMDDLMTEITELQEKRINIDAQKMQKIVEKLGLSGNNTFTDTGNSCISDLAQVADALSLADVEARSLLKGVVRLSLQQGQLHRQLLELKNEKRATLRETNALRRFRGRLEKSLKGMKEGEIKRIEDMQRWSTELEELMAKEKSFEEQSSAEDKLLSIGFESKLRHGTLVKLAQEKQELENKIKPLLESLQTFSDLPPDIQRAELIINQKEREFEQLRAQFDEKLGESLH